jgi:hypothetical protein
MEIACTLTPKTNQESKYALGEQCSFTGYKMAAECHIFYPSLPHNREIVYERSFKVK